LLALTFVICPVLAACGTRVADSRFTALLSQDRSVVVGPQDTTGSAPVLAAPTGVAASPGGQPAAVRAAAPVGVASRAAGVTAPSPATVRVSAPTAGGTRSTAPGTAPTTSAPSSAPVAGATCTTQGAPLVLGQTGVYSGFLAPILGGFRPGLAAWAQQVNAAGGLYCHHVQLYQEDDGGDPSKVSSNARDLLETKHAQALVGVTIPIAIAALRSVVDQAKVPVVGGDLVADDWNQDPYLFTEGSAGIVDLVGSVKSLVKATGKTRLGILYCVEASICQAIKKSADAGVVASQTGAQPVFTQSISLTQTGFTSECQNAKDAGVQVMFLALDGSAMERFYRDCRSIGFNPPAASIGVAVGPDAAADPLVQGAGGIYLGSTNLPYVSTGTSGAVAYHAAMARYAPGVKPDESSMAAYASGKLLEAALATVSAQALAGPITTAMILQGLGQVKNQTLGGLSVPLTFTPGQPSPMTKCYFVIKIDTAGVTSPDGTSPACL